MTIGASWCGPCRDELPVWDCLAGEVAGRATLIALDLDDELADGKAFHKQLGLKHMTRAYLPEQLSKIADHYGAATMPMTFVIGPDGIVRYVQPGFEKSRAQHE